MAARVTVTQLRTDIYNLLDRVIDTGEALEIERRGVVLRVLPAEPRALHEVFPPRRDLIVGDPAELVELDWSDAWSP